jgi:acetyltransferase-like isoleucine patch superfamily enzyme
LRRRARDATQRVLARLDDLSQDFLEIRSGDPLARKFASFGSRSRIAWPRVRLENPAAVVIGEDVEIRSHLCIEALAYGRGPVLRIGDRCVIGHNVRFVALNGIELEEDCGIGHGITIADTMHDWRAAGPGDAPWRAPLTLGPPLRIESGAWIGNNCVVVGGLTIGARAIVAPNSVVTRDLLPDTMVSGNPARRVPYPRG